MSDEAPSASASTLATPSSLDRISLMTLYFLDKVDEHRTFAEIGDMVNEIIPHDECINEMLAMSISQIEETVQSKLASPFDLFGVFVIKIVKEIQIAPTPEFIKDVTVVNDLFDGHVGPVEGAFDFVDPPLSFDVLSGFVSRSDNVHDSSFMDLSIFEYLSISCDITLFAPSSPTSQIFDIDDEITQHDSDDDSSFVSDLDLIDQRVSPTVGNTEIVDFDTVDQPRELRIGSNLSVDKRDSLIQLLGAYLDVFAWSYKDMPGLDPSIVQHRFPFLPHARLVKQKLRRLHPRWSLQVNEEIQK